MDAAKLCATLQITYNCATCTSFVAAISFTFILQSNYHFTGIRLWYEPSANDQQF